MPHSSQETHFSWLGVWRPSVTAHSSGLAVGTKTEWPSELPAYQLNPLFPDNQCCVMAQVIHWLPYIITYFIIAEHFLDRQHQLNVDCNVVSNLPVRQPQGYSYLWNLGRFGITAKIQSHWKQRFLSHLLQTQSQLFQSQRWWQTDFHQADAHQGHYCFSSVSVTLLLGLVYLVLLSWSLQFIPFVPQLPGDGRMMLSLLCLPDCCVSLGTVDWAFIFPWIVKVGKYLVLFSSPHYSSSVSVRKNKNNNRTGTLEPTPAAYWSLNMTHTCVSCRMELTAN